MQQQGLSFNFLPQLGGVHGAFAALTMSGFQRRPGINLLAWVGASNKLATDKKFLAWLEALKRGEDLEPDASPKVEAAAPRMPHHPESWYTDRCVFCASCKESINSSTRDKRGVRCQGCRRWFHNRCRKALPQLPSLPPQEQQQQQEQQGRQRGAFFHCEHCRQQYSALAALAAKGAMSAQGGRTLRLLELPAVKQQYKERLLEGDLPTVLDVRRAWTLDSSDNSGSSSSSSSSSMKMTDAASAADAGGLGQAVADGEKGAAASTSAASSPADGATGHAPEFIIQNRQQQQRQALAGAQALQQVAPRRVRPVSALEEFLAAAELLDTGGLEEPVDDLLEDSFGLLLRKGDRLVCAATFNLHAPDHARVQSLVTDVAHRREGHAAALLGELQSMLSSAGVKQLVVVLDEDLPQGDKAAAQRLLRRKCGFVELAPQQLVAWRKTLPDYHPQLLTGSTLMVKPLKEGT